MRESKIIQTIIITMFVVFFMVLTIQILPVNLTKTIQAMADSVPNTDLEGEFAMVYYGTAAFSIGMRGIGFYFQAIIILIISLLLVLFAVHNRDSNKKWIRYYNYALAFCSMFMIVSSIIKMILWRCGY